MVERWIPATPEELTTALADGRLDEGPYLDLKQELGEGRRANLELAKDLAMFANDGGCLIYGVAEPQKGRFVPASIQLTGLRERVEQVAAQRCDPPLRVDVRHIFAKEEAGLGFLVVRIPASPEAPHMVEGKYHGRMGTTRSSLSNDQVRAIIAGREADRRPILQLLEEDVERDPVPERLRTTGHLYVVAKPRFAPEQQLLASVSVVGGWATWIKQQVLTNSLTPRSGIRWYPDLGTELLISTRANGAALHAPEISAGRQLEPKLLDDPNALRNQESYLLDLEINEDGTLHLFSGCGPASGPENRILDPAGVAGLVVRVVQVAALITYVTHFVGTWDIALSLDGLRGASIEGGSWLVRTRQVYSEDLYRAATAVDSSEVGDPLPCLEPLLGKLMRGFGHTKGVAQLPELSDLRKGPDDQ